MTETLIYCMVPYYGWEEPEMENQVVKNIKTEWKWMITKAVKDNGFDYCIMNENNRHEFDDNYECYHCGASYDYVVGVCND
jgi:hypothetical protein